MMQVPRKWIYNYSNANSRDAGLGQGDGCGLRSAGPAAMQSKTVLYIQPDVLIRGTANAPGYPQVNQTKSTIRTRRRPATKTTICSPARKTATWTTFHEMGHGQYFAKFTGETESAINLLHVAVKANAFGWTLNTAFAESCRRFDHHDSGPCGAQLVFAGQFRARATAMTFDEMKYQHRGHGKYVEIANLFGWNMLSNFWYSTSIRTMRTGSPSM